MQQNPHSAFSPPFCSDDIPPDSSLGEEGKGGEGKLQSEVGLQPQPEQQEEEPQSLPPELQSEPQPQTQPPETEPEPEPQPPPEPEPQPEPDPQPEPKSPPPLEREPPPEPQADVSSEGAAVEFPESEEDHRKLDEQMEATREEEEEAAQAAPPEDEALQEEEEEGGGAKGGGTGRRASLHHTASPLRVQRNGAGSHSATSDYELSLDLKNKQVGWCRVGGRGWGLMCDNLSGLWGKTWSIL